MLNQRVIPKLPSASGGEIDMKSVGGCDKNDTEMQSMTGLQEAEDPDDTGDMPMTELEELMAATTNKMEQITEPPQTPCTKDIPPFFLLSDIMQLPSPTNITNFPYFDPWAIPDGKTEILVRPWTTTLLPRVLAKDEVNMFTTACI